MRLTTFITLCLAVLLIDSVEVIAPPGQDLLADYFRITGSDSACSGGDICRSEIIIDVTAKPPANANFNTTVNFDFDYGTTKGKSQDNQITGITANGVYYELYIQDSVLCTNMTGADTPYETCNEVLIPFSTSNLLSRLKNTGDKAILVLKGHKPAGQTVKWTIRVGDLELDPAWESYVGFYTQPVNANFRLDNTTRALAHIFRPPYNLTNITNVSLWRGTGVGTSPVFKLTIQGYNGTQPNGIIYATATAQFNSANSNSFALNGSVDWQENVTGAIVLQYLSGSISAANAYNSVTNNVTNNTQEPVIDLWMFNGMNQSTRFMMSENNGTLWYTSPSARSVFMLSNGVIPLFGNPVVESGANTINESTSRAINFTVQTFINVTSMTVSAAPSPAGTCTMQYWIVNQSIPTSTWQNNVLGTCSKNVTVLTRPQETCTFTEPITLGRSDGVNVTYTAILYNVDDACGITLDLIQFPSVMEPQSYYGNNSRTMSTVNNWSTVSTITTHELGIYMAYVNLTSGGGASACSLSSAGGYDFWPCDCAINTTITSTGNTHLYINGTGNNYRNASIKGYSSVHKSSSSCAYHEIGNAGVIP